MAKKNILHKNKNNIFRLFILLVLFLLLALIIPAIGFSATSPAAWINAVTFFESVKIHFSSYWMFYTFIAAVLFAYLGKSK